MNKAARRLDRKWLWLAGFGLLLWACSPTPASQDRHSSTSMEETTVNLAHRIHTDIPGLPAINKGDAMSSARGPRLALITNRSLQRPEY